MADEVIGFKIKLDEGNAGETVKSFKSQLKEANTELMQMSERFGASSKAAQEAAKKVAELRDQIGDARAMADAFHPDAKFNSLTQAISGATGMLEIYQGSLGMLGISSETVEKQLLKVQSAMALSQGLNSFLDDGIQGFKNLALVIGNVATKAFGSLKAAMISTGIGAFVVAVGLLAANWDKVSIALGFTTERMQRYKAESEGIADTMKSVYEEVNKVTLAFSQYHAGLIDRDKALSIYNETLGKNLGYAKNINEAETLFRTKTAAYVEAARERATALLYINKAAELQVKLESLKAAAARGDASALEGGAWWTAYAKSAGAALLAITGNIGIAEKTRDDAIKEGFDKSTKAIEKEKKAADEAALAHSNLAELKEKAAGVSVSAVTPVPKAGTSKIKPITKPTTKPAKAGEKPTAAKEGETLETDFPDWYTSPAAMAENHKTIEEEVYRHEMKKVDIVQMGADMLAQIEAEKAAAQQEWFNISASLLGSFSDLVGRNTEAGKGFAVAETTISTYMAAQKAYQSQLTIATPDAPVRAGFAAATAIASGLVRVKNILAVNPNGKGGVSAGTAPNTPSVPRFNTVTELNKGTIDKLGDNANKAYVLETDIASNQKRIERIKIITKFK